MTRQRVQHPVLVPPFRLVRAHLQRIKPIPILIPLLMGAIWAIIALRWAVVQPFTLCGAITAIPPKPVVALVPSPIFMGRYIMPGLANHRCLILMGAGLPAETPRVLVPPLLTARSTWHMGMTPPSATP